MSKGSVTVLNERDDYHDVVLAYVPSERVTVKSMENRPRLYLSACSGGVRFTPPFPEDLPVFISFNVHGSKKATWEAAKQVRDFYIRQKITEKRMVVLDQEFFLNRETLIMKGEMFSKVRGKFHVSTGVKATKKTTKIVVSGRKATIKQKAVAKRK